MQHVQDDHIKSLMKVMGVRGQVQSKKDMIAKMFELIKTDETKCVKMFKELKTHTGTYFLSFNSNLSVECSLVNIFLHAV